MESEYHNKSENIPELYISEEQIDKIKGAKEDKEVQKIIDQIFTQERRKLMFKNASKDRKGRSVVYFRVISKDKLVTLLENGNQTYQDYFEDLDEKVDEKIFKYFLLEYANFLNLDLDYDEDKFEKEKTLKEIMIEILSEASEDEIDFLLDNFSYKNIIPFLEKNFSSQYMKKIHTGSFNQKFSSFLSMSVGGPVSVDLRGGHYYLEIILPDEEVVPHEDGVTGEKEVFAKKISLENISRIGGEQELYKEVLLNSQIPVGEYYEKTGNYLTAHEEWRWNEPTEDCLPKFLLEKKKELNSKKI